MHMAVWPLRLSTHFELKVAWEIPASRGRVRAVRAELPDVAVAPAGDEHIQRDMVLVRERLEAHRGYVTIELAAVHTLTGHSLDSEGTNIARRQHKAAHQRQDGISTNGSMQAMPSGSKCLRLQVSNRRSAC